MKIQSLSFSILILFLIAWQFESCSKPKKGCTDPSALNYDADAKESDGSCAYLDTPTTEYKLIGIWPISVYLNNGINQTVFFDTTYRNYTLQIDSNYFFNIHWSQYSYTNDSPVLVDTLGYDSVNSQYIILNDTLRFTDTIVTPHNEPGQWILLNSETDLKLTYNTGGVATYHFLALDSIELKLRKGNEDFYFHK